MLHYCKWILFHHCIFYFEINSFSRKKKCKFRHGYKFFETFLSKRQLLYLKKLTNNTERYKNKSEFC